MKTKLLSLCIFGLLALAGMKASAQFSIDSFTITGGGGTSTGGVFAVSGTTGQPDASAQPLTNGTFSLTGGFWSIFTVRTPDAPLLSVDRQGTAVRVFWPLPATGFVLDQSLTVTGAWSQVSFPYTTNATDISISLPMPTASKYYRLRQP